jgi:3-phenylpropionate/cinnamic acid dioxygenase small subunit
MHATFSNGGVTPSRRWRADVHSDSMTVGPDLQLAVEQFYYREARLLDNRQYQSWLALCSENIRYVMPARTNPLVDNAECGKESMISIEHELDGVASGGTPIRDETYPVLALRVQRSFKPNAWAENPPARTRRIVGNVEILNIEETRLSTISAFHLFFSRPGSENFLYAGQRRDILLRADGDFRIESREIVMDMADIEYPTLGLFL